MKRDYSNFNRYYASLLGDIYPQPEDEGHSGLAFQVIEKWFPLLGTGYSVLDMGCGQGFCQPFFERFGWRYIGITLGEDYSKALGMGRNVVNMDMNFIDFPDNSFDVIFSRHSLEHSPFPVLTLMEWYRVAKHHLCLIIPSPGHYSWACPNHYGMASSSLALTWLERAGWRAIWQDHTNETEFRFMCEKIYTGETQDRYFCYEDRNDSSDAGRGEEYLSVLPIVQLVGQDSDWGRR